MTNKIIRRADQIIIDTSSAYEAAIAEGGSREAALEAAVAVYQRAYPQMGKNVSRHLAAVITGHKLLKRTRVPDA
jgi:hypothetical protein